MAKKRPLLAFAESAWAQFFLKCPRISVNTAHVATRAELGTTECYVLLYIPEENIGVTMRLSVILSTYNAPHWLEKTLWGYAAQSHRDFDIIVAEDGASEATRAVIDYLRSKTDLRLHHVWHQDRGFRKCTILNRAIEASRSEYLVFSDGDCIPRRDFLEQHAKLARPGQFLSGGTVRLPLALSQQISADDVTSGRVARWPWLVAQGMRHFKKLHLMALRGKLADWADRVTPTRATWNGHNVSGWRRDLIAANGYDERMEYGGLDRELGERLVNAGIQPRQIRHRAICIHLDHARSYKNLEALNRNQEIRRQTASGRKTWTPYGITQEVNENQGPLPKSRVDLSCQEMQKAT